MRLTGYGPGDPATWGPCMGHPHDPRTDCDGMVECSGPACLAVLDEEEAEWIDGEPYCGRCADDLEETDE